MSSVENKVALVTGSTGGVGRHIALELAKQGADVVVNGRTEEKAKKTVSEIQELGQQGHYELADIRDTDAVQNMVDGAIEEMGQIDILVCSGGAASTPPTDFFRDQELEAHMDYYEANYLGRIRPIKAILDHFISNDGGQIVVVGSDAGRVPTPGEAATGASNAALLMGAKVLSKEFARWNIQVNAISISVTVDTPGLEKTLEHSSASSVFEKALERQDFPVHSDDIGEAVAFLASDRPITGQILSVNGGISVV